MIENLKQSFLYPSEEFTPYPFWFWNDNLTEEKITNQINDFYQKGVNGFVIHPRIGIPKEIEYLSDEFMKYVLLAVKEAKKLNMKVILYDEAMYPSGSAHGMVVKKNPSYASKGLKVLEYPYTKEGIQLNDKKEGETIISTLAVQKVSDNEILADSIKKVDVINQRVHFDTKGEANWVVLVFVETFTKGNIRGIHFGEDDGEPFAPASADLLNSEAMKEFIKLTHERYYEVLSEYFGDTIIAMFTDEPCIMGRGDMTGLIPWTTNFLTYYVKQGNKELDLPFLFYRSNDIANMTVKQYEEAIHKKMEESYYHPIYTWCEQHKIAQTGHPHESDDIGFLKYFHIPAQDIVWRWVAPENGLAIRGQHSTMAKCTSDSARHRNVRRNGNECFACCGIDNIEWAFTAEDMKWYMDWMFVRGVNLLFPHAFYYSIDGPRRIGERPPDVGPNNIWWPFYNQISDYCKRMCELITDAVNQAQIAVLCGTRNLPWKIVTSLYENQIEFNYLENELFTSTQCRIEGGQLKIEKQNYRIILIEDYELINESNKKKLTQCIKEGIKIIVLHNEKSEKIAGMIELDKVENAADIVVKYLKRDFVTKTPVKELRMTHLKKGDCEFYYFVNEGEEAIKTDATIHTIGTIEKWDAMLGEIKKIDIVKEINEDSMKIELVLKRREAVIYYIKKETLPTIKKIYQEPECTTIDLKDSWRMGTTLDSMKENNELIPFNEIEEYKHFSGTMLYQTTFSFEGREKQFIELDLGQVHEIAQVSLNGKQLKAALWGPYVFDISNILINGMNTLCIEVRNTRSNQICKISRTSGLIGPVRIHIFTK
ncbi:glycosylhydrolase-like jelly roll fold domain-containing protein [Candidatus Galacturonibacter soehngenii]|uniref:Glycosyl hydrolases family 2 sugar binding domain-containing protein n=1 Tax=Candidatus Galacturonatibacter soehngenii TaxID=2307010 RepID=A0A7V7QNZ1_9FIRM|nr:glycosylhydrolase-like jelly roll fold domain-containing protein [Candidatus Galacturonibacter soehngenii]KAB1441006.1 hypothetical protein F7O84_00545 [Candidatus Galacturonibacter soehngenii]